ncbi:condensation domain-containing protein [Streptomyces sp. NBC_00669]|uniref:condensation domain-containing protein n=1 Tax=Streptomyces sp. NBC_00669 TaxID=2976011 RepID=UPI002E32CBF0|nr:condensation domain-containing protein [Streptomyces sp. NBC_00669]
MDAERRLVLRFSGLDRRSGPMTWSQYAIWSVIRWEGETAYRRNLPCVWSVPPGVRVDDVLAAFEELLTACETLRTTFRSDGDWPRQEVHGSGEVPVVLSDAGSDAPAEHTKLLLARLLGTSFDLATDVPLRLGIVTSGGQVVKVAAAFSHVAVDGWSVEIVRRMVDELLTKGPGALRSYAGQSEQPLERAEFERSEAGVLAARRTLRFWQRAFDEVPSVMFAGGPESKALAERGSVHSHHIARAVRDIVVRDKVSSPAVLAGAVSLVLSAALGESDLALRSLVVTRFRRQARYSVATLNLNGLFRLKVEPGPIRAHFLRAAAASLQAVQYSQCNPDEMEGVIDSALRDRGEEFKQCVFLNDVSQPIGPVPDHETGAVAAARGLTARGGPDHDAACCDGGSVYRRMPDGEPDRESKFLFTVARVAPVAEVFLYLDRRFFPVGPTQILRAVESVLTEAARDPHVDTLSLARRCLALA